MDITTAKSLELAKTLYTLNPTITRPVVNKVLKTTLGTTLDKADFVAVRKQVFGKTARKGMPSASLKPVVPFQAPKTVVVSANPLVKAITAEKERLTKIAQANVEKQLAVFTSKLAVEALTSAL